MVHFISERVRHHATHSGYHRLQEFVDGSQTVNPDGFPGIVRTLTNSRLFGGLVRRVAGIQAYSPRSFRGEVAVIRLALRKPGQIFHFIYGDGMYRFAGTFRRWLNVDARLICSFHQPPGYFYETVRLPKYLGELDAAIIVGNNQREMLSSYMDDDKVFFVPHGVDTDFFCPPRGDDPSSVGAFTCLTVGKWLRDFDTLRRVILQVNADRVKFRFVVVTFPDNFRYFEDCPGVELESGVDELTLRALYQSADALLLPLTDCTANNSLLEGIACGLPVVTTDIGGVRDYVDESCAILTPLKDAEAMASALMTLSTQPSKRRQMGLCSRERALQLNWKEVASQVMEVFRRVQ